jgi:hypothetical protein
MEEAVRDAVHGVIPVVEAVGALIIVVGVFVAFGRYVASELRIRPTEYVAWAIEAQESGPPPA